MLKALLLFIATLSIAQAGETEIKSALQKKVPQIGQINSVAKSPVPGL